jgi:hypothetical protein
MLRRLISTRTQLFASALSTGLLLACGDDSDSKDESAESEEHSDTEHDTTADSPKKPSTSAAKPDAGSTKDEAAAGGAAPDKPKDEAQPAKKDDAKKAADKPKAEAPKQDADKDKEKPAADNGGDEKLKVSLRFHAKVGKSDFACSHKYAAQGTASTTVTPLDLRLFVHAVELIKEDGSKVPLSLIAREPWQSETLALLDFEDKTGRCADGTAETNTAITGTAPGSL